MRIRAVLNMEKKKLLESGFDTGRPATAVSWCGLLVLHQNCKSMVIEGGGGGGGVRV